MLNFEATLRALARGTLLGPKYLRCCFGLAAWVACSADDTHIQARRLKAEADGASGIGDARATLAVAKPSGPWPQPRGRDAGPPAAGSACFSNGGCCPWDTKWLSKKVTMCPWPHRDASANGV